jgi:hypothetical protein
MGNKEDIESLALEEGPRAAARAVGCSHNAVMRHMKKHFINPVPPKRSDPELKDLRAVAPRSPQAAADVLAYKRQYPHIAGLKTASDRRRYLNNLFRLGRFYGLRTSGLLSMIWDDLGPIEFAELVSQAAIETNFRRGSEQARRVALLGRVEQLFQKAVKNEDLKTAARLVETLARLDIPVGVDLMTALASSHAWPIAARVLQKRDPALLEEILGELNAEEARKRQVLAPTLVESDHAAE